MDLSPSGLMYQALQTPGTSVDSFATSSLIRTQASPSLVTNIINNSDTTGQAACLTGGEQGNMSELLQSLIARFDLMKYLLFCAQNG